MTEFIEVKTAELIGSTLDWAVSKAECVDIELPASDVVWHKYSETSYSPSSNWSQGGPLIDKYKPWLSPPVGNDQDDEPYGWDAEIYSADGFEQLSHIVGAPTALIAACRAIVAAKLGETVRVPVELMK